MLTYFIAAAAFALIIFLLNFYIKFKSLENKKVGNSFNINILLLLWHAAAL